MSGAFKKDVEGIMFNKQDPFLVFYLARFKQKFADPNTPMPVGEGVARSTVIDGGGKKPKWGKETLTLPISVRCGCGCDRSSR